MRRQQHGLVTALPFRAEGVMFFNWLPLHVKLPHLQIPWKTLSAHNDGGGRKRERSPQAPPSPTKNAVSEEKQEAAQQGVEAAALMSLSGDEHAQQRDLEPKCGAVTNAPVDEQAAYFAYGPGSRHKVVLRRLKCGFSWRCKWKWPCCLCGCSGTSIVFKTQTGRARRMPLSSSSPGAARITGKLLLKLRSGVWSPRRRMSPAAGKQKAISPSPPPPAAHAPPPVGTQEKEKAPGSPRPEHWINTDTDYVVLEVSNMSNSATKKAASLQEANEAG